MKTLISTISLLCASALAATPQVANPVDKAKAMQRNEVYSGANVTLNPQFLGAGDGTLSAGIVCLNSSGEGSVDWSENFDNGTEGWTLKNAENFSWQLKKTSGDKAFANIDPADVQSLFIEGSYRYYERGTAEAISPAITIGRNMTLSGYAGYSYNLSDGYCTLTIYAGENGADWKAIWSSLDSNEPKSWAWHRFDIDLGAFAGKTIQLKFEYGNTQAADGMGGHMGDFTIDGLQITGAADVTSVEVQTGETVKFADASSGTPTSWQWNFPGGTPESSTEQNPEVCYTRDGIYDVSLTVGDGTNTSTKTLSGFVKVTGTKPTAIIGLPATFRFSQTRLPMIAPLAPVQFSDLSEGFPTEREWTFTGASEDAQATIVSTEENPVVNFMFQHQQAVFLTAKNEHGESTQMADVSVEYEGIINNLQPEDALHTFDLDGYGEFPGTNRLGITEYAEKFSKPSKPMLVYGAYLYVTDVKTEELLDQISDVKVALCKSENGLPGEQVTFASWRVFELDLPQGSQLVGTEFEFSKPVVVDDEFFIVVSGIPEKSETCTVSFATAKFRSQGNTAYFKQRGEWKAASDYFPAGANHTSYAVAVSMRHSVMTPLSGVPIKVGEAAGEAKLQLFSYMGYKTPVESNAPWCRVTSKPNGMTVDDITIGYDELPKGMASRTATLTFTDGVSAIDVKVIQEQGSGITENANNTLTAVPTCVDTCIQIWLPETAQTVEILSTAGTCVYRTGNASQHIAVDASSFPPGVYIVRAISADKVSAAKFIKR